MKSNEKYVFSLIYYPRRCLAEEQNFILHARRLGSRDYFDVIYSTFHLVYNMVECGMCGKANHAIFLRLRWKLEDF